MAQVPTISVEVDKGPALRDIKAIRSAMLGLRKTLVDVNKVSGSFATAVGGKRTTGNINSTGKAIGGLNTKLFELAKAAQLAAGPLSGFAARLTAFNSLVGVVDVSIASLVLTLAGFGVALTKTVRLTSEFELGLIGVSKASDLVGMGLQKFGSDILKLSSQLALPSTELLVIAENAARLGIQGSEDILKFTKTIGMITRATDLTAQSASTAFARILKVTNTATSEVDTLANVIVRLGNNVAATESEITDVALSIARASGVFGIGAEDAATLGAAFAQFGIQSEVAGSTVGRVLGTINDGLKQSGTTSQLLAEIMGKSLGDVKKQFETDALGGLFAFLGGVKQLEQQGVSAIAVLREFGLEGIREAKALLPLIDNITELARVMVLSKTEIKNNSALLIEFGRFSEAFSIVFGGVGINIKNIAIELGRRLLPSLTKVAGVIRTLTSDAGGVAAAISKGTRAVIAFTSVFLAAKVAAVAFRAAIIGVNVAIVAGKTAMLAFNAAMLATRAAIAITTTAFLGFRTIWAAGGLLQTLFVAGAAMAQLRKATAGVGLASLATGKNLKFLLAGLLALGVLSDDVRDKLVDAGKAVNGLIKDAFGVDLEEHAGLLKALLFGDFTSGEDVKKQVEDIEKEIAKLMGTLGTAGGGEFFDEAAKNLEKVLTNAFNSSVNAFEEALKGALSGDGNFFKILRDGIKSALIGGLAAGITESVKRSVFAPLFQGIFSLFVGGTRGTALAESAAGLKAGSLPLGESVGLFSDLGDSLGDAIAALDMFAFKTFGIGEGRFGTTSIENVERKELQEGTKELIGVTEGLSAKIKDLGSALLQGGLIGGLVGGRSFASFLGGGIGKVVGDQIGKALGDKVGGSLGKALGPIGGLLGSVAGGLLGSLFSKKARSQTTLTGISSGGIFTRGSGNAATGQSLAGSVGEALSNVANALGGQIANITFGTIGQRGEEFFFDPRTGGGLGQKDFGDPDQFRYATAEEAVRAAIRRALEVGVVEGLGESVRKVIAQSPDTQSLESLISDLQFAQEFDKAFGTLNIGLTEFEKGINDLNASFDEAARQAQRLGLQVQRVEDARRIALLNQRVDFNKEIELLILDIVDPMAAELKRLEEEQKERLRNVEIVGGNIAAVEALAALERQQVIEQFATQTNSVLRDYLLQLTATTQSALAPEVAVQNAAREFSDIRSRFMAGETQLASDLVAAGQNLLDLRRVLDASGPGFFDTLAFVQDTIEQALAVESAGTENPQLQILTDIAFANEEAIQQRDRMIELLENQTSTTSGGTTTPGDGTPTINPRTPGGGTGGGIGGSGGGGGGLRTNNGIFNRLR